MRRLVVLTGESDCSPRTQQKLDDFEEQRLASRWKSVLFHNRPFGETLIG